MIAIVLKLCKLGDIKLAKTQISKIVESGQFLGRILASLQKAGLTFMKNAL